MKNDEKKKNEELIQYLYEKGVLSSISMKILRKFMTQWSVDAYDAILELHLIEEVELAKLLAKKYQYETFFEFENAHWDSGFNEVFPLAEASRLEAVPVAWADSHKTKLKVVFSDPSVRDNLEFLTEKDIKIIPMVGEITEIRRFIAKSYPLVVNKEL